MSIGLGTVAAFGPRLVEQAAAVVVEIAEEAAVRYASALHDANRSARIIAGARAALDLLAMRLGKTVHPEFHATQPTRIAPGLTTAVPVWAGLAPLENFRLACNPTGNEARRDGAQLLAFVDRLAAGDVTAPAPTLIVE